MTVINKVSRRYAKAFFGLANEGKDAAKLEKEIVSLKKLCQENDVFEIVSNHSSLSVDQQQALLSEIADKAKSHKFIKNLILVLNKNRRLEMLESVCDEVLKLYELSRSEIKASVKSASKLSATQTKKIGEKLSQKTGWNVTVETEIDENLIGGLVIRLGSYMIDSSIQTKLEKAKRQLKGAA